MAEAITLKKSNCKNCYKCIRHCPVKSIRFSGNQAHIISDECILCGTCLVVCPQNAKQINSELEKVRVLLQSPNPVVVSLAPSFAANYKGVGIEGMREALRKLGFSDVEETAVGATIVTREYERLLSEDHPDIVLSSACHAVNLLVQKHYPDLLPYLADVVSPMQAHALEIKKRTPDAKVVFVGPCVAKKDEGSRYEGVVDAVLTFEELTEWFADEGVKPAEKIDHEEKSLERFYPTPGGILATMRDRHQDYVYFSVDGVDNCIELLDEIRAGNVHHAFVEMSSCHGSCVGGPLMDRNEKSYFKNMNSITEYAGTEHFEVEQPEANSIRFHRMEIDTKRRMPSDSEIREVLKEMGKPTPEQELNCGSCGYESCRAKAIAVLQGKAEISMCLPYLKDKAESFSDTIVRNTPNALIVVNDKLEVQQINDAALRMMNLRSSSVVLGDQIVRVLDPKPFQRVRDTARGIYNERLYLTEYNRYVEQTVVLDRESHNLVCIMRDITAEEDARIAKEDLSRQTVEIADKVVEKQMRIVQEIASLLGETTAETKIALSKLKESITHE